MTGIYKIHIWRFPNIVGTPKWMVKIMENPIKMDDLGGKPSIFGNTHMSYGQNFKTWQI